MSAITDRIKRALNHGGPSMGYILSDAGTPRAITKVEITEDTEQDGVFYLEIAATSVAVGDTIHADLYLMA